MALLFLNQVGLADASLVGPKAATLGQLLQSGIAVPNGFVIPATVYDDFVAENHLDATIASLESLGRQGDVEVDRSTEFDRVQQVFRSAILAPTVIRDVHGAFAQLVGETGAVVVRSSAIDEDGSEASSAGQQLTVLNVRLFDDFLRALRQCWASLFRLPAIHYRSRFAPADRLPRIAVLVQSQITVQVAGTLFTVDPVTGAERVVIESTWGLGEAIAQGEVIPDRFLVDRGTLALLAPPRIGDKRCQRLPSLRNGTRLATVPVWRRRRPTLNRFELGTLSHLGLRIEQILGSPQDVEWGQAGGGWYVFQARPITTSVAISDPEQVPGVERWEWTSGFLDERLTEPVSPLGWSVLRSGLESVAFREPLQMLGVDPSDLEPITRCWNGLPYVNVAVFEALYKIFPDWLLPEDARRFFPNRDVTRRKLAREPRSLLSPRPWRGLIRAAIADPAAVSPWHNDRLWDSFERTYVHEIENLATRLDTLEGDNRSILMSCVELIEQVERLNYRLLQIHRWSLTHAEVWYSLLRRLARRVFDSEVATAYCADVVADLDDYSVQLNRDLASLDRARDSEHFPIAQQEFLHTHGHRSFSLDLIRPNFAADPSQIQVLFDASEASKPGEVFPPGPTCAAPDKTRELSLGERFLRGTLTPLVSLTRRYARLRENQRFTWQRGIALLRRIYLRVGVALAAEGCLNAAGDVFFLTADEVRHAAINPKVRLTETAAARAQRYAEQWTRFDAAGKDRYPRFLRGNVPLIDADVADVASLNELHGEPVSPGHGRGPARIVRHPNELNRVATGDVLVVHGADPGWTPVFGRLAGLIMETGGQLSHASVVAREYHLPAVVGISRATEVLHPGDLVEVDGARGTVRRLSSPSSTEINEGLTIN
ncbi:MAG TPA: PEP/pyruvate-binding domain-containing protein [Chloroflexota bacterium]|nr:PEP/pyruvate-binding domain-containing protein [Chloroflexota bacterium]